MLLVVNTLLFFWFFPVSALVKNRRTTPLALSPGVEERALEPICLKHGWLHTVPP
jgi:hypothetical protein